MIKKTFGKVLLPTAYLPSLEYMLYLTQAQTSFLEQFETYPRQTWRNRCTIMTANGLLDLVVPVFRPQGNQSKTKDVLPSNHERWYLKHWRAIKAAYGKAPYFLYYGDLIKAWLVEEPAGTLLQFNLNLVSAILNELDAPAAIRLTEKYEEKVQMPDLRDEMTPKMHLRNIQPPTKWPAYYQVFAEKHGFKGNLSVIDLLFHLGPETVAYLEEAAELNFS